MDSPRDMEKKRTARYGCSMCQYASNRYFNIVRHIRRIHTVPKKQPQCCDITFESKAEYYLHCEDVHPGRRINSTSQRKYGILAGSVLPESIVDASKPTHRGWPQTRYMLRSRGQPENDTELGKNSVYHEKDDDCDDEPMESTDKSSKYENKDSSSSSDDEGTSDLDYESDNVRDADQDSFSEDSSDNENLIISSSNDSQPSREEDQSTTETDDHIPNSVDEERKDCKNRNPEESSTDPNGEGFSTDLSEEIASPPRYNSAPPTAIEGSVVEERKSLTRHAEAIEFLSSLPLKKRILHDFAAWNNENIDVSRKPIGDRLYRKPISFEAKVGEISTKCRQSRKERESLIKKMSPSMRFSASENAENVPPVGSGKIPVEFRKEGTISWPDETVRHREYLSSINFQDIERYRANRYFD